MSLPRDKYKPDIPNGYFNKLNSELEGRLMEEEIFDQQQYLILFGINKNKDFTTPLNYIESLDLISSIRIKKNANKFQLLTILTACIIAISIFALSIKKETPENNDLKTEELLQYFATDEENLDELYIEDLELFQNDESEYSFLDIEKDILIDYLIENSDQLDLSILY